jgi:hypothetical protein
MITMCTVFSSGKDKDCSVFRSMFIVDNAKEKQGILQIGLDTLQQNAIGVRDSRNKMAHNMLTLHSGDFDHLVESARKLLQGVCSVLSCISQENSIDHYVKRALAEIDIITECDLQLGALNGLEHQIVNQQHQGLFEEREWMLENEKLRDEKTALKRKLGRKFDSFAPCLMKDIRNHIQEGCQVGGHGEVYMVEYRGQNLAVKIFHSKNRSWRQELNTMTFLTHTNIVRIFYILYESLDDRERHIPPLGYVMEQMTRSAADQHEYTIEQLLNVFEQIGRALEFAHQQDIIHFDVKPANILLDASGTVAKLCDFGCALKLTTTATASSHEKMGGTHSYMAPEAFREDFKSSPDAKLCDIYSFGKTMWKLLHPHPSFHVEPCNECTVFDERVPLKLQELIQKCTLRDSKMRPQNMSEVLDQLRSSRDSLA